MLDTNMCIFIIKRRPLSVLEKLEKIGGDQICISVVTYAELVYGVERSSSKKLNKEILDEFISHLAVLPWGTEEARQYGKIRTYLEKNGTPIGNMDLLIAAHALSEKHVLATNNLREFKRVPHLRCEDWSL